MSTLRYMLAALVFVLTPSATSQCPTTTSLEEAQNAAEPTQVFAMNFYKNWSSTHADKNLVFSPVSIMLGLVLLFPGASGATWDEIMNVLGTGSSGVHAIPSYTSLHQMLRVHDDESPNLLITFGIFRDVNISLKTEFVKALESCFQLEFQSMDYKEKPEEARKNINAWVSNRTMTKIPQLFKPGTISNDALLIMATAAYFESPWQSAFSPSHTKLQPFFRFGREKDNQSVPFMHSTAMYRTVYTDGWHVLELAYKNTEFSMYILLPVETDGLPKLESNLTGDTLTEMLGKAQPAKVNVALPKFAIRTSIDLKDILSNMGLQNLFTDAAEFDKITDSAVKVGEAAHEAVIKVNESGTQAAASAASVMVPLSGAIDFVANHPFLYAIVSNKLSLTTLFLGRVNYVDDKDE